MIINYPVYKEINAREYIESFYLSKSKVYKLFNEKKITKDNNIVKETDLLKAGDIISIFYDEEIDFKPSYKIPKILYEDDYLLIVDKEAGILIHSEKENDDSLSSQVAKYYLDNNIKLTIKFAHRIDFDTTGIVIFAKDMLTHSYLNHFIETHDIKREYLAIAGGIFKSKRGFIEKPIGRDRHNAKKMRISEGGSYAKTYYEVVKEFKYYSLVRCVLETGRTHQIRVHMASLNHPLFGDDLYGGNMKLINRCALHSAKTAFIHPVTRKKIEVEAKLHSDMLNLL